MAEVPRIVRERLQSQAISGGHPDANLLSTFAERALTEQEREQVLGHLSRCPECREALALSIPEFEPEAQVAAAVPAGVSHSWWRSPIVHWSALTVAALVVMIAVGTRMQLRQGRSASAPAIAKYEPAQKSETQAPETAPAPTEQKESRKLAQTAKPPRHAETFNGPRPMAAVSGGKVASGDKVATGSGSGAGGGVGVQNLPSPPPPPAMKAQASADAGRTGGPRLESRIQQSQAKAAPALPAATDESVEVTAEAAPVLKSEGAALSQGRGATFAKRASLSPRWSVSDSGAVQRSFDGGRSWQEVAVGDGVSFRAVATVGSDVWAGGSSGALFHSSDGGEHWARVRVQANGRALSGDIVRIEFTDARDGVVATSTGETWTTSDAGATWQRQ